MLTIEMLPARNGDCLWITYGDARRPHHVLIDGGFPSTSDLLVERLAADPALRLDLLLLSHIDEDHIFGGIQLLARDELSPDRVDDVWFNGWQHLVDVPEDGDELGAKQGEYFSALLERKRYPWNRKFRGERIMVPADGALPTATLAGGMKLTLLSPDAERLRALRRFWVADLKKKIAPGDLKAAFELLSGDNRYDTDELGGLDVDKLARAKFVEDRREPNGSSIAVLAEHGGKRMLLAADAYPSVIAASLERLGYTPDRRLKLDVLKLSHHGSQNNTSPELLDLLDYEHVLISTNGERHDHPHAQAIARVVAGRTSVQLHFNYVTEFTEPWLDRGTQKKWKYTADHGDDGAYRLDL